MQTSRENHKRHRFPLRKDEGREEGWEGDFAQLDWTPLSGIGAAKLERPLFSSNHGKAALASVVRRQLEPLPYNDSCLARLFVPRPKLDAVCSAPLSLGAKHVLIFLQL